MRGGYGSGLAWFLGLLRGQRTLPANFRTCAACRIAVPVETTVQANGLRFCPRCTGEVGAYRGAEGRSYCPDPVCLHAALADASTLVPVAFERLCEAEVCATCNIRLLDA